MEFSGTLYVVDCAESVIDTLKPRYAGLLPHATIYWLCRRFEDCADALPRKLDAIIGSHIMDDMLLNALQSLLPQAQGVDDWVANYTHAPSQALTALWAKAQTCPDFITQAHTATVHKTTQVIKALRPKRIILNQYPSATLNDHGLQTLNARALTMQDDVTAQLMQNDYGVQDMQNFLSTLPHYNNPHIGQHVLNARYWISCHLQIK